MSAPTDEPAPPPSLGVAAMALREDDTPLVVPIVPRRRRAGRRPGLRLTPLVAASAVAVGGLLALFLLIGVRPPAVGRLETGPSRLTVGALLSPPAPTPAASPPRTVIIRADGQAAYEDAPAPKPNAPEP